MNYSLTSFLQINLLQRDFSSVPFYVFLLICILLVIAKLNQPNYFSRLFIQLFQDESDYDSTANLQIANANGIIMQLVFVLIVPLAFSMILNITLSWQSYLLALLLFSLYFIIQSLGSYLVSRVIANKAELFLGYRFKLNELSSLLVGVFILISFAFPTIQSILIISSLVLSLVLTNVAISANLIGKISSLHIILYLCILELTPVLVLTKYI